MFPLNHWFRSGVADFHAEYRWTGSRPAAIAAIREALADDPWSAGLRRNLAGFLVENGDIDLAEVEIAAVHRISPKSKIVLRVNTNPATR